jgi:hypothetical protein
MAKYVNKITVTIILAAYLLLSGCYDGANPKILVAKKTVKVYRSYNYDQQEVVFLLYPGEQCAVGRKKIAKMYAYYQILNLDKGLGWVIAGDDFVIYEDKKK